MLENSSSCDTDVLRQSLFYYCSGKDPTPIAAFGAKIPLYVYVDSFIYMKNDFFTEKAELYKRLIRLNFSLSKKIALKLRGRLKAGENAELTIWKTAQGANFALLFVQGDAEETFKSIYRGSKNGNYIKPRYVCNYRYELRDKVILEQLEKRAEYIMGHCFEPNFRCIGEYGYYGDYSFGDTVKVKLYRNSKYSEKKKTPNFRDWVNNIEEDPESSYENDILAEIDCFLYKYEKGRSLIPYNGNEYLCLHPFGSTPYHTDLTEDEVRKMHEEYHVYLISDDAVYVTDPLIKKAITDEYRKRPKNSAVLPWAAYTDDRR